MVGKSSKSGSDYGDCVVGISSKRERDYGLVRAASYDERLDPTYYQDPYENIDPWRRPYLPVAANWAFSTSTWELIWDPLGYSKGNSPQRLCVEVSTRMDRFFQKWEQLTEAAEDARENEEKERILIPYRLRIEHLENIHHYYELWQLWVEIYEQHGKLSTTLYIRDVRRIVYDYLERPCSPCSPFCTQIFEDHCPGCDERAREYDELNP